MLHVAVFFPACSTWFADAAWASLGFPDAWLHTFYQAVLAPVRVLWRMWPKYKAYYTYFDTAYDIAASSVNLSELVIILVQAFAGMMWDAACQTAPMLLAAAALVALALNGIKHGDTPSKGAAVSSGYHSNTSCTH